MMGTEAAPMPIDADFEQESQAMAAEMAKAEAGAPAGWPGGGGEKAR